MVDGWTHLTLCIRSQLPTLEASTALGLRTMPNSRANDALRRGIPEATVARLPIYHRVLSQITERGIVTVSSEELAAASGVSSAKLRKDLSFLGSYGTRGVGYDSAYLLYQIQRELGLTQDWPVVIVGVGNLGHALANYGGFANRGFRVVGLIDADPELIGETVTVGRDGEILKIQSLNDLEKIVNEVDALIGVIATPAAAAQDVCDRLVDCGVTSILNFAPVVLTTTLDVHVRKVDLATELQILAFHEQRRGDAHEVIV